MTAACQIVFSYPFDAGDFVWDLESQLPSSFPGGLFKLDVEALQRMQYVVDSSWISYTFAITFLVLCFVRQIVDGTSDFNHPIIYVLADKMDREPPAPVSPASRSTNLSTATEPAVWIDPRPSFAVST